MASNEYTARITKWPRLSRPAATTRLAAASRRRRHACRSSRPPSGSSRVRATRTPRWPRSRRRPAWRSRPSTLAFETKSGVLRALWNLLLRGDQGDAPVAERDWYREVAEEPDPERRLWLTARASRTVKTRIAGVLRVIRNAAPVDPDIEALWNRIETDFHANQRAIVEPLGDRAQEGPRRGSRPRTSSGRSTIPTPGTCWSASADGHPRNGSGGSPTPPARSCSGASRGAPRSRRPSRRPPVARPRSRTTRRLSRARPRPRPPRPGRRTGVMACGARISAWRSSDPWLISGVHDRSGADGVHSRCRRRRTPPRRSWSGRVLAV